MVQTQPDIAYAVGVSSRSSHNPAPEHWQAMKHLLRYLSRTRYHYLKYSFPPDMTSLGVHVWVNASYAGDLANCRSTSGHSIQAGGGALIWHSSLQSVTALSSCEAEYYGLTKTAKEVLWFQSVLKEVKYHGVDDMPMVIQENNHAAIELAKNPEFDLSTKHIDVN
jgi:hypothetical protein